MTTVSRQYNDINRNIQSFFELIKSDTFTLGRYIESLNRVTQESHYCDSKEYGYLRSTSVGKGFFGSVGKLQLCSTEECVPVQQLLTSYGYNGNFRTFSIPLLFKSLSINQIVRPEDKIEIWNPELEEYQNRPLSQVLSEERINNHHTIPERYMEVVTSAITSIAYDRGYNPHIVKAFGIYPCGESQLAEGWDFDLHKTLDIVMEQAEGGDLTDYLAELDSNGKLQSQDGIQRIKTIITQALMGQFSLFYHTGIMHIDAHFGNIFVKKLPVKENTAFYAGQDMKKDYIRYTGLKGILGDFDELIVETYGDLVKIGDYGLTAVDLSQAKDPLLTSDIKFSQLGEYADPEILYDEELFVAENANFNSKIMANEKVPGKAKLSTVVLNYFKKTDNSAPFWYFWHVLLNNMRQYGFDYFNSVKDDIFQAYNDEFDESRRFTGSRYGRGPHNIFIRAMLEIFTDRKSYNFGDKRVLFITHHNDISQEFYQTIVEKLSLEIKWNVFIERSPITNQIARLPFLNNPFTALEYAKHNMYTNPYQFYSLEHLLIENGPGYEIDTINLFPQLRNYHQKLLYQDVKKDGGDIPDELIGRELRSCVIKRIRFQDHGRHNVRVLLNQDIYDGVRSSAADTAVCVNLTYFAVESNFDNTFGNMNGSVYYDLNGEVVAEEVNVIGDPLGCNAIRTMYVNDLGEEIETIKQSYIPYPWVYEPFLRYIAITRDGYMYIIDPIAENIPTVPFEFKFAVGHNFRTLMCTYSMELPNFAGYVAQHNLAAVIQTGPVLFQQDFSFSVTDMHELRLFVSEEIASNITSIRDQNNILLFQPNFIDELNPIELINLPFVIKSGDLANADNWMFVNRGGNNIYAMKHSNVMVNHNSLVLFNDGIFEFLLIAGRNFESEGLARHQIPQILRNVYDQEDYNEIIAVIDLDGGFSANACFRTGDVYKYALNDPERRQVGTSLLIE